MNGLFVILSSPSGGGKTSVIRALLEQDTMNFKYSVSATTRKPRPGETDGTDYYYLSEEKFKEKIERNEFVEWEKVHNFYYGTPRDQIEGWLRNGETVLLDIDVQGGLRIKKEYPDNSITIFIAPPSLEELIKRLKNRKTDSEQEIDKRLKRVPLEMEKGEEYDYVIINDKLEETISRVNNVINLHKS